MPGRIDNRIPTPAFEFMKLSMSISLDALYVGCIIPTIKKRHLMPTELCRSHEMLPQESRPTKYQ